ncbi:hypothetical protein JCM19047_3076 [Bacillus sp. JCM 19047]|uniref:hypothetical protein n=1 Tax=Shouchella miscanthi TaxID=2598861 RepID=UPI0003F04B8E|nr:hypothetical protein [Shouchella miscanthi]GAF23270.1 hypothetical protein JCM19047_3076 [Bacillus sp. JCM 19047]
MTEQYLLDRMEDLKIHAKTGAMSRPGRFKEIEKLIEAYYDQHEKVPPSYMLEKLASLCLHEELSNRNSHKMAHECFPILTDHQHARRNKREKVYHQIEFRRSPITGSRSVSYVSEDNSHTKGKQVFYVS